MIVFSQENFWDSLMAINRELVKVFQVKNNQILADDLVLGEYQTQENAERELITIIKCKAQTYQLGSLADYE